MLELHLGFISDDELAQWCDKSIQTFKKNRARWLNTTFSKYAIFTTMRGGVNITHIITPVYQASGFKEVQEKWEQYWGYGDTHFKVDSITNCWEKLKPNMANSLKDKTGKGYVSLSKCRAYGVAYKKHRRDGDKGYCHYIFCKLVNGQPMPFTDQELEIQQRLNKKYLSSSQDTIYQLQALKSALDQKEITLEEYTAGAQELAENDYNWQKFQKAFEDEIGYPTDFRQKLEPNALAKGNYDF